MGDKMGVTAERRLPSLEEVRRMVNDKTIMAQTADAWLCRADYPREVFLAYAERRMERGEFVRLIAEWQSA